MRYILITIVFAYNNRNKQIRILSQKYFVTYFFVTLIRLYVTDIVSLYSTAYRKLPFELGPLPPHPPDCCILAQLEAKKSIQKQNIKQKRRGRKQLKNKNNIVEDEQTASTPIANVASTSNQINTNNNEDTNSSLSTKDQVEQQSNKDEKIQKKLKKLRRQLEVQRGAVKNAAAAVKVKQEISTSPIFFSSSITTRGESARPVLTIKTETMEKKMHKRNLLKDFAASKDGEKLAASIKRGKQNCTYFNFNIMFLNCFIPNIEFCVK